MKSAVTVGIILLLAFVGAVVVRLFKTRADRAVGFRDWVRNPGLKRSAGEYFAARDKLTVPEDISDGEIQAMVDRLFVQQDEDFNLERLKLVGAKAVPMLIMALENPQTAAAKFPEGGHALDAKSPFERIVDLLHPLGTAEAATSLATYIDHDDDHFRKQAAMALGNTGTPECIAPLLKALNDRNGYVRSHAMTGIERGMAAERSSREFLDAMVPALVGLLKGDSAQSSRKAASLLLAIDQDRALAAIMSADCFSIDNRFVHAVIAAVNAGGHTIAHDVLLPFLASVKPLAENRPYDAQYAEALIACAHNPDDAAEERLRTELQSTSPKVQQAAATALAILVGVTNARAVVLEAVENMGFDQLSPPRKHYFAVSNYHAEVNNGGHAQYFVNSSGEHWQWAVEGLAAIGATARLEILQQAIGLFGTAGPPEDNTLRHQQVARFSRQQEDSLHELDSRYYACQENPDALLVRFVLDNSDQFRSTA